MCYLFFCLYLIFLRSITCIEDLSNEIFYEIFDYIDGFNLYEAFGNLNIRFQGLITHSFLQFSLGLEPFVESNVWHYYLNRIFPNRHRIISLCLLNTLVTDIFFILMTINSSFHRLKSLVLIGMKSDQLISLLVGLKSLSYLFSLTIYIDDELSDSSDVYQLIFNLPILKYNKLSIKITETFISLPIATNDQCSRIQRLIIDHSCTLYELKVLISYINQLVYLTCRQILESEQNTGRDISIKPLNLLSFAVDKCDLPFDEFEIFIKEISSHLQVLRIYTLNSESYLNIERWEQLISENIPNLHRFHFQHSKSVDYILSTSSQYSGIDRLTSSFWIKHRWYFEIKFQPTAILLSIDPHKESRSNSYDYMENSRDSFSDLLSYAIIDNYKNITNTTKELLHAAQLTIMSLPYSHGNSSFIKKIHSIVVWMRITNLNIDCSRISINNFIELVHVFSNIDSLNVWSSLLMKSECLSVRKGSSLRYLPKTNKITRLNFQRMTELTQLEFLIDLCPCLEYLEVECPNHISRYLLIRKILVEKKRFIPYLTSLCLCVQKPNDKVVTKLEEMINQDKLLFRYSIKRMGNKIYLQWD